MFSGKSWFDTNEEEKEGERERDKMSHTETQPVCLDAPTQLSELDEKPTFTLYIQDFMGDTQPLTLPDEIDRVYMQRLCYTQLDMFRDTRKTLSWEDFLRHHSLEFYHQGTQYTSPYFTRDLHGRTMFIKKVSHPVSIQCSTSLSSPKKMEYIQDYIKPPSLEKNHAHSMHSIYSSFDDRSRDPMEDCTGQLPFTSKTHPPSVHACIAEIREDLSRMLKKIDYLQDCLYKTQE